MNLPINANRREQRLWLRSLTTEQKERLFDLLDIDTSKPSKQEPGVRPANLLTSALRKDGKLMKPFRG